MLAVVKNGINPILNQYDYPELNVKIGMDEGENFIVQYGQDRSSPIDILGYCMNIAAKITSLSGSNKVSIGEYVYKMLHPSIQLRLKEIKFGSGEWKCTRQAHWPGLQSVCDERCQQVRTASNWVIVRHFTILCPLSELRS